MLVNGLSMGGVPPSRRGWRFLRLINLVRGGGGTTFEIFRLRWLSGDQQLPTTPMTGPAAPAPLVATSPRSYNGTDAWLVFDGSDDTLWMSDPEDGGGPSLILDLGAGAAVGVSGILMVCNVHGPVQWRADASQDGVDWRVLYNGTSANWGTTPQQEWRW